MFTKITNYVKSHPFITGLILLCIIVIVYFLFRGGKSQAVETLIAEKGTITEEVSVTGMVKPSSDADLSFEKSGTITGIYAKVGDVVYAGQTILTVSNADLVADLAAKKASVAGAQAKLAELKRGARVEEVEAAKRALVDAMIGAYTSADDAIRNKVDQFYTNSRTANPRLVFQTDFQLKNDLEQGRYTIELMLVSWNEALHESTSSLEMVAKDSIKNSNAIKIFLNDVAYAVNNLTTASNLSQTTIDTWKSAVSGARVNVNSTATVLTTTVNQLAVLLEGTAPDEIAGAEASLAQAEAAVSVAEAQLAKTIIRSPINGMLTKQEAKYGETVQAGQAIVAVIGNGAYQIEAYIPEADIAKVKRGDGGSVTLDAYGSDVLFSITVTHIDPAETVTEGVATYKTIFTFEKQDERIRSGMTANITIVTNKKDAVVTLPARAISTKDGKKYVNILGDKNIVSSVEVTLGLKSSDGRVEILSGLKEGETVVVGK